MVLEISAENFQQEVKEADIPVLMDFWAPWCGPCQMMGPVFDELSEEFEGKIKFVKVNVDENQSISSEFAVQGIPCIILSKNGEEAGRIVGFSPKAVLKKKIEDLLENS